MSTQRPIEDDRDRRLGEAIDEYLNAVQAGQPVTPETWVCRYPDLAHDLSDCLDALRLMQQVAPNVAASKNQAGDAARTRRLGVADRPGDEPSADRVPRPRGYSIIEETGRGGMGVVYKALQLSTKRVVAIKYVALSGFPLAPGARLRFAREVELAAALDHPGIVRILESGEDDGHPYYAMEFVDGAPLHLYIARKTPSIDDRLRLFVRIAKAIQYAHHRAVIHRDLKPSNIIVDSDGEPRVLDFGLACAATPAAEAPGGPDCHRITQTGQLLGTLPYVSPEQAAGDWQRVEVRSDLYSLGVILYEMLTGRHPYDTKGDLATVLQHICHTVPQRPSQFCAEIGADLDAVVLKALEKPIEKRYQTAADLAEDVRCYLRREPVEANRTTRFYLLRKAYARHRRQVQLAAAALGLIFVASSVILALYVQVRRERNLLDEQLHISTSKRGSAHLAAGHDLLAEKLFERAYRECPDRQAYWSLLSYHIQNPLEVRVDRAGWVTCSTYSARGEYLAYGTLSGEVVILNADNHGPVYRFDAHAGGVTSLVFWRDCLVTGGADGRVRLWATRGWEPVRTIEAHSGGVTHLRISAPGTEPARDAPHAHHGQQNRIGVTTRLMSTGADGRVVLWTWENEEPPSWKIAPLLELPWPIMAADLSSAGDRVAIATPQPSIRVVDADTGRLLGELTAFEKPVEAVRFSPDGSALAAWSFEKVSLWDWSRGLKRWEGEAGLSEPRPTTLWDFPSNAADKPTRPHVCWTPSLDFSDDGSLLASAGWDAVVRVRRPETGAMLAELRAHETAVYTVAFAPRSHRLAAGCVGPLRIWDLDRHPGALSWEIAPGTERTCAAISRGGDRIAWGGAPDSSVSVLTPSERNIEKLRGHAAPVEALAFGADGRLLATADRNGQLIVWQVPSGRRLKAWSIDDTDVWALAFSPDGSLIATGGRSGTLQLWNVHDGTCVKRWEAHSGILLDLAFSPDGRRLISGAADWMARIWEIGRAEPIGTWRHLEWVNAVAFSPDGTHVATGGADLIIRIGRPDAEPETTIYQAHAHWINSLVFLDGGRVLASGGNDGAVRFWDVGTGRELASLPGTGGPIDALAVTSDGGRMVVGMSRSVQLIDFDAASTAIAGIRRR